MWLQSLKLHHPAVTHRKNLTGSVVTYYTPSQANKFRGLHFISSHEAKVWIKATCWYDGWDVKITSFALIFYYCYKKLPKFSGLNNTHSLFYSSGGQNCAMGLTGLKWRCQQPHVPSGSCKGESLPSLVQLLEAADIHWHVSLLPVSSLWPLLSSSGCLWLWASCIALIRTSNYIGPTG